MVLKCDNELLEHMATFVSDILSSLDTNFTGINEIFVGKNYDSISNKNSLYSLKSSNISSQNGKLNPKQITSVYNWRTHKLSGSNHIYIKKFKASPVALDISFYQKIKDQNEEKEDMNHILAIVKRFGLSFTTIEDAPITLNALELDNVFGTTDDISFILK